MSIKKIISIKSIITKLDSILKPEEKIYISTLNENELNKLNSTLGVFIKNRFLFGNDLLINIFYSLGFYNIDDIVKAIILLYYNKLNDKNFDLKKYAIKLRDEYTNSINIDLNFLFN